MAVKKRELVADSSDQLDLEALAQYFDLLNEEQLPPFQEMTEKCHDIIECLARTAGTADQLWHLLQPVEHFLFRCVNDVYNDERHKVIREILDKFYSYISDPDSNACPATAAVLIILDNSGQDEIMSSARILVEQSDNGPEGPRFRAALSCLYRWLHDWHCTPALGVWLHAFIKALEECAHYDILIETSQDHLGSLLACLVLPIHQASANVILHVLASLRESGEAFDKIFPMVGEVLVHLASDNGQWSRQLLQDLVDILYAIIEYIGKSFQKEERDVFYNKYSDVILCLEQHMASGASAFLVGQPWRPRNTLLTGNNYVATRKVGLLNLGNTCYMNSVVQALLVARQFSTHVILKQLGNPYWEKLGELFAHMLHSVSCKLDPGRFFTVLRPPFFTLYSQHDSSEFLGYLLELLQSYEHISSVNYDYSRPPVLNGANRYKVLLPPSSSGDPQAETGSNGQSTSPSPGSSGGSTGFRREIDPSILPPRKRFRAREPTRRMSAIDSMFGGVLLTRVQCTFCRTSSYSHDMFRHLQLAFPDKPDGKQHTVQTLLQFYCSIEKMTGANRYRCVECVGLRDAERSALIESAPKYLILIMKHFKVDSKTHEHTKLMHSVHYNQTVTLPTVRNHTCGTYSVFAAVIHTGAAIDSGHYYTIAKDNEQWYSYNDCSVINIDDNPLNKLKPPCTPYILFYRRSDVEEPAAPTLDQLPRSLRAEISADNKLYVETVQKLRLDCP